MAEPRSDDPFAKENLLGYVDWFALKDRQRLERVLERLEGVEPTGENEWTWFESTPSGRRVIAELAIEGGRFVLESYRERDADLCRSCVERSAGSAVEFLIGQACFKSWGGSVA